MLQFGSSCDKILMCARLSSTGPVIGAVRKKPGFIAFPSLDIKVHSDLELLQLDRCLVLLSSYWFNRNYIRFFHLTCFFFLSQIDRGSIINLLDFGRCMWKTGNVLSDRLGWFFFRGFVDYVVHGFVCY